MKIGPLTSPGHAAATQKHDVATRFARWLHRMSQSFGQLLGIDPPPAEPARGERLRKLYRGERL